MVICQYFIFTCAGSYRMSTNRDGPTNHYTHYLTNRNHNANGRFYPHFRLQHT